MLNYLELENWKAHGSSKILFSKGTNVFIGQMGAGKSSVLDAISFALFGTFPGIKNRRTKVSMLIRNRPEQKKTSRVKLSFSVDNIEYTVERTISLSDSAKAKLERNGVFVQSQPERVTEEIEKALKIDYDIFSRAVYSEQNRLDYFLEMGASDRKKQIDNLLGIDRFAIAYENTGTLINKMKDMVSESQKILEKFDINSAKEELELLEKELESIKNNISAINLELTTLRENEKVIDKEIQEKKILRNKKILLEKEVAELLSKVSVLDKESKIIKNKEMPSEDEVAKFLRNSELFISEAKKERLELSELVQKEQQELGKLQNSISDLERKVVEKKAVMSELERNNPSEVKEKLESTSKTLVDKEKEYSILLHIRSEGEKSISELKKDIAKCPICDTELSKERKEKLILDKNTILSETNSKIKSLTTEIESYKKSVKLLEEMRLKLERFEEKKSSFDGIEEKKAKQEEEIKLMSEKITKTRALLEASQNNINKKSEEISTFKLYLENYIRLSKLLKEMEEVSAKADLKKQELNKIHVDDFELDLLQKRYTTLKESISEKSALFSSYSKMQSDKIKLCDSKKKDISLVENIAKDLDYKKSAIDNVSKFRNALQETQGVMRQRLISSINETMQSLWPEIYPYGDYSGIMMEATEDDYSLKIRIKGEGGFVWEDVNSIASGGEKSIACITMRIAFSLILVPNLKWLILDEPTHNIDSQGLSKIVLLLNERLPKLVDQIFIITHDEKLKQVSNARIYLFLRNKAENQETTITEL
ncbi:MAG: AAA family ATPase [Candidatus Micrarchaeia archaeon]